MMRRLSTAALRFFKLFRYLQGRYGQVSDDLR